MIEAMTTDIPDYFTFFAYEGEYDVHVEFSNHFSPFVPMKFARKKLAELIDGNGKPIVQKMLFDDYPAKITQVEINEARQEIVLYAEVL